MATITIEELIGKLNKLENIDYTEPLTKAAFLVENEAKKKCPVGTGELRNSITSEVEGNQAVVGSNLEYAPYVEFGTGIFSSLGNGRQTPWTYYDQKTEQFYTTQGQEPQPYLIPALDENKEKIKEYFVNKIVEVLK